MQSTSARSSGHSVISDASTVKYLQRNIILSESEGQVSPVKDVTKHKATLSEKREDCVDYSYNDDGVGVLTVQETFGEVRQGVRSSKIKIKIKFWVK